MDDDTKEKNVYPNLRINGRIFPIWILKNFAKYKLPEIIRKNDEDPCQIKTKLELRKYQEFIGSYLDYRSPYRDILIYHGLGSGKSATTINLYNVLYNATSGWNVFLLIKAALHDDPWEKDIKRWMSEQDFAHRYSNIHWIHYDSPFADKEFLDVVKNTDSSLKNLFIIEEAHNFIRNVYSNLSSQKGDRAINIYNHILQDKKDNPSTRVVLLSGTPAINKPFELALMFNLLRPNIFPKSEVLFEQYYVDSTSIPQMNLKTKNMFQRRIMGLVSYYIGATPDLYATQTTHFIDVSMSKYQTEIYNYFEEVENKMALKKRAISKTSETYRTYTRQCSNFVFPPIDDVVTGENRPRPSKFKIGEKEMEMLLKTKDTDKIKETLTSQSQAYFKMLNRYIDTLDTYFQKIYDKDLKTNSTISSDIENFSKYKTYSEWFSKEKSKSELIKEMAKCSCKFTNCIFNIVKSTGPVLVYSNYVLMEGLDVFKVYLKFFGFDSFKNSNSKDFYRYGEFHNGISKEIRKDTIKKETDPENVNGKLIKIVMFSPAGAEGISLANIRQVHIIEPYWNEVRIIQMIGRAIRQCSHKDLLQKDRHVDIYRYRSVKYNVVIKETIQNQMVTRTSEIIEDPNELKTVDFEIEELARSKNNLISSFLDAIKEVAIDCELFKNHNMIGSKYRCFKFNEISLFDKNIGPAYKDDILEDIKISNGSNSTNSITVKVKVIKIRGIEDDTKNAEPQNYWYNPEPDSIGYGVIYDYDLNYPVGKVKFDIIGNPEKLDKDTYKVELIPIPSIKYSR
jgi:hypothetical protein